MFNRLRRAVGRLFGRQPKQPPLPPLFGRQPKQPPLPPLPPEPPQPPIPPWPPEPPPLPPEPPQGPPEDYEEQITIVDDWGIERGRQTYDEWIQDSLLTLGEFQAKYGDDFDNIALLYLLMDYSGDWGAEQWEAWRNAYEARNG